MLTFIEFALQKRVNNSMCMRLIFQLVRNEDLNFRLGSVTYFDSVYIMGSIKFLLEFIYN